MDHTEKIQALTLVIKDICEENNLNKKFVIKDFIYQIQRGDDKELLNRWILKKIKVD